MCGPGTSSEECYPREERPREVCSEPDDMGMGVYDFFAEHEPVREPIREAEREHRLLYGQGAPRG